MDRNYLLSNKITTVKITPSISMIDLTKYLLQVSDVSDRQRLSEQLLDELCDATRIDIVNLKISDTQQYHKKQNNRVSNSFGFLWCYSLFLYIFQRHYK